MDAKILEIINTIAEDTRKSKLNAFYAQQKIDEVLQWLKGNLTNIPQPTQIVQQSTEEDKRRIYELEFKVRELNQNLLNSNEEYNKLKAESDRKDVKIRELYEELEEYKADPERSGWKSRMNDLKANCEQYESAMIQLNKEYQEFLRNFRKEREQLENIRKQNQTDQSN